MVDCEPAEARLRRREAGGQSAGEDFADVVLSLAGSACDIVSPVDPGARLQSPLSAYDAAFVTGSPLHLYQQTPDTLRLVEFMKALFASGSAIFGSCAGLQAACVAAGGSVRPMAGRREIGFARRLHRTAAGVGHPLLAGRPEVFEAPAVHADEIDRLPLGALHLAQNEACFVQAAEIRSEGGVFWGVQYHPELSLEAVAGSLRREGADLVREGLVETLEAVERQAELIDALAQSPGRLGPAWRLGLDEQCADPQLRCAEINNFLHHLVLPLHRRRGRN